MALLTGTRWAQPPCSEGWGGRLGQLQGPAAAAVAPVPLASLRATRSCQPALSPSLPYPSIRPPICLPIHSHICPGFLPPCPPFPFSLLYIHLSIRPPIPLSTHPFFHPSIQPATHPPIHPSVHPFTHPCIQFVSSFVHPPQAGPFFTLFLFIHLSPTCPS